MAHQIFCDATRSDDNGDGLSKATAKKTLAGLWTALSANLASATDDIDLVINGGLDYSSEPAFDYVVASTKGWTDALNHPVAGKKITFKPLNNGVPRIMAAAMVTGWAAAPGMPGVIRAPFSGDIRNLWLGGLSGLGKLQRCSYGGNDATSVVWTWDEINKYPKILSGNVPTVASWRGVEFRVIEGWTETIARIDSVTDMDETGQRGIVFKDPERTVEFDLKNAGPFRNASGQRCSFWNAKEFLTSPGDWWHDTVNDYLYMVLPTGFASAAAVEAAGVYAPNGCSTFMNVFGSAYDTPVRNLFFERIRFQYFGYNKPNSEGFIGHLYEGTAYIDSDGVVGSRALPGVVQLARTSGIGFDRVEIVDDGANGITPMFANSSLSIRNSFAGFISGAPVAGNGGLAPFETMPENQQTRFFDCVNNEIWKVGRDYPTVALYMGAAAYSRASFNRVVHGPSGAILFGAGGRWHGLWTVRNEVIGNRADALLRRVQDAGYLYVGGNQCAHERTAPVSNLIDVPFETVRAIGNYFTDAPQHLNDPAGGFCIGFYFDLGARGVTCAYNKVDGVATALQENCAAGNFIDFNDFSNYDRLHRVNFSGFQVYDQVAATWTRYTPPWNNPPNATDQAAWDGTGDYAGRGFKSLGLFASIDAMLPPNTSNANLQGDFNSRSHFGSSTFVIDPAGTGPSPDVIARYAALRV